MIAGRIQSVWFGVSFMLLLGVFLPFLTCKLYQGAACDDQIARNSPVVCMKIITRNRGLGTLKILIKLMRYTIMVIWGSITEYIRPIKFTAINLEND